MARTPLLRMLINIARRHQAARALGVPVHALDEIWAKARGQAPARGISRRQVLTGGVAAAAAIAIPRWARADIAPRIAIVGGGISGLSAALALADNGVASTLYEASSRIGGRMHSLRGYWNEGQVSEWCGELIDSGHTVILNLAQRFGLLVDDLLGAQPIGSTDTYYFFGKYYPYSQAVNDFGSVLTALNNDNAAAPFPTLYNSYTPAGVVLDKMSVYDWIESRVPGGHSSPMGALLDVAYAAEFGADTVANSALNIVYMLGFQPTTPGFSIFGFSDEHYHIQGGNDQLPKAIAGHLAALRMPIHTGWRMAKIEKESDGTYELTFETYGSTRSVKADYVILTLPFAVLRGLDFSDAGFDALKTRAINELGNGRNGKLQLQFDNRVWSQSNSNGVSTGTLFSDTGIQNTWDVTRAQPGTSGIMVKYTAGDVAADMTPIAPYTFANDPGVLIDAKRFLEQVEPIFPGMGVRWNGKASSSLPFRDGNLRLSYSYWKQGQYTGFSGYEGVRQGNCSFAGEHCSINFQGFMEGGAEEGMRAAGEVLTSLGLDPNFNFPNPRRR